MSINSVHLLGRLGKDSVLAYSPTGQPILKFSLATSEKFKDKEGKYVEKTEWHNCVVFGKLGESISKYLLKGTQIYLEGKLQTRKWDDKQNVVHFSTEVIVDKIELLGEKRNQEQEKFDSAMSNMVDTAKKAFGTNSVFTNDDIPF